MKLTIENSIKKFRSPEYNYDFNLDTGYTLTWGRTLHDDPDFCPYGNTIADIEISYGAGCPMRCSFCYKGNTKGSNPTNMSLDTFKQILDKFPRYDGHFLVQQIAFGITSVQTHPEFFPIARYCRANNIIPNVTVNGANTLSDQDVSELVSLMGAMAISVNQFNFENGLNLIARLIKAGANQINIHYVISKETVQFAYKLCEAYLEDPRLKGLNAIVFLSLKPKNRGERLNLLPEASFHQLIRYCLDNNIPFGADSCSGHKVLRSLNAEQYKKFYSYISPCEASHESLYLNAEGIYFPCSFLENEDRDIWQNGINILEINDFLKDLWLHPSVVKFRRDVQESNRRGQNCCHFNI